MHDELIQDVAYREAMEETGVRIPRMKRPNLVGIDVHFIPAKGKEPYHLHHDLKFALRASHSKITTTEETRAVAWCPVTESDFERYSLPMSIRRAARRALAR